ncbi:uncharacterized protein LOC134211154 [Armigeres subalbatus]|uniref:uncharacterized protein LOC134211154 n=1 Tax=Armigeres subalbatus TaxID=124917 RepID=UPI002ED62F2F
MDLSEHELADLEERLYSRIHHATEGSDSRNEISSLPSMNVTAVSSNSSKAEAPTIPIPVRLVTDKSVINNARRTAVTASSKIKRYWDSLQQQTLSYPGINKPKKTGPAEVKSVENNGTGQVKKVFTPYQSIINSMRGDSVSGGSNTDHPQEPKQKRRKHSPNDGKQSNNPSGSRHRKMDQLKKIRKKKSKAVKSRQRSETGEQRLVATIDLDTSSEEEGEYVSPDPIKQENKQKDAQLEDLIEDSDPDEVVLIPSAPPPLVCIEDSEDDGAKDNFTHPKSKKKKKSIKKINSPRCISPSNSSIMSDDFLGQSDRNRINDSFIEGINNDEELDCTAPHTVGSLLSGERTGFEDVSRQGRAPSISSDCTVATSSDTTDPDKRNGLKQIQTLGGRKIGVPQLCSTPKQTLVTKKSSVVTKPAKCIEEDSIYAATTSKKSKSTDKRPSSDSSNESDGGNVSSHSKRSKSYQSDTSTKSIMKRRKKCHKQDSEHYSDEDFASMLTDIVQAISENEEETSNNCSTLATKPHKCNEEDNICAATTSKKSKSTDKRPSIDLSNESDDGNASSHSKRSKSYQSDTSTGTKTLLKRRKKRHKQDSEHYSDEDFASMLTDIVQAISENEEESSEEELGSFLDIAENPINTEQPSAAQQDVSTDQSMEAHMVVQEKPEAQTNLPQVEFRAPESSVLAIPPESSNTSTQTVVTKPTPVVNLVEQTRDQSQPGTSREKRGDDIPAEIQQMNDDPECSWNDEMRKFYNDSWNCEDFNISTVLFNMPRANKYWPIVHKDKYPDPPKKEIICNNCGERGHMRYKCRNPPKPKTCYMCGLAGHQEVRCPNTLCLKCGEKTRNFLRGCQSCSREQNITCHLCGIRGHGHRNCPDKWRRYHSTTEDNKPLVQQYVRNPNAKHCCICSRAGHQAHMCNAALRIFGQLVPTTEIKSYQPVYQMNERVQQQSLNNGAKFNLFSNLTHYQLNFDESFAANEKSFYYRFAKSVGIVEEKKRKAEKLSRKLRKEARKQKNTEVGRNINTFTDETVVIDDDSTGFSAQGKEDSPQSNINGNQTKPTNEDSNYSFSEFYEDESANLPQPSEPMPDFIPLVSTETSINTAATVQQFTDAKIFLTKPHAKILLGPIGAAFLKDASSKFSLKVSILFQTVGNVLLANGQSADQDNFHNELVKFLNNASHQNEQLKLINNVPKATEKIIRFITDHLLLLTRPYENAKVLFKRYQHFEGQGANAKTCDKIRRTLNIILFGQYGLRAGREHLTKLQNNLNELQNTAEANASSDFRDEINQHIRYIFTSFDHANYEDIINEFDMLRKNRKLNKITREQLNLPKLMVQKPANDSFNLSKDLDFEVDGNTSQINSTIDEDLILNTSDQLIDLARSPVNFDDQSYEDSNRLMVNPLLNTAPIHQKKHITKKMQHVGMLVEESRHMVQMLNNAAITEKFERISSRIRNGRLSKTDYRMLKKINLLLRNKLNRK